MLKKKYFKTVDECEVSFEYQADDANEVHLVTEANKWEPLPMARRKKDGVFYTKLRLPKDGRYQFRYLIDKQRWDNDDAADAYVPNEHGSENSVVNTSD